MDEFSLDEQSVVVEHAIRWALAQLGSEGYPFKCLAFVEDAYEWGNAIEIFGGSTAQESAEQYGVQTGDGDPPAGAFVFYDCLGTLFGQYQNWGHVGLSLGDGRVIHAWKTVRVDPYREVERLQPAPGWTAPRYSGWTPVARILQGHRARPLGQAP